MVSSSDGEDFFASSPSHNLSQPSDPSLEQKVEEVEGSASPVKKRSDLFRGDDDEDEDEEDTTMREPVVVRKRQKIEHSEPLQVKKASPSPPPQEVIEVKDESDWPRKYVSISSD